MVKQAERSHGGEACEVSQAGSKTQFERKDIEPSRRKWVGIGMQAAISLTAASCAIQQAEKNRAALSIAFPCSSPPIGERQCRRSGGRNTL